MKNYKDVEHALITKYRKDIWRPFMKGISDYQLIKENDHIAVCISGGKDSFLLAKCLQELKRHGKVKFNLSYIIMNPGYKEENLITIIDNLQNLNIENYHILTSDIFEVSNKLDQDHPCYMCARMRRGFLYNAAKKLGCNKIALGHHFDDVIETVLLSIFYGGEFKTMMPKLHSTNFLNMELIRPLYHVKETAIKSFWQYNEYSFINCACKFTESNLNNSKRLEIKELIASLRKKSKVIDTNIFKSTFKVNLSTIISYQENGEEKNFLDRY